MSGILSKWLVLHEHPVTERELTGDGMISDDAVERWVDGARSAYLEQCDELRRTCERYGLQVRHRNGTLPPGAVLGHPHGVVVSASASEFRPSSFTISVRLRALSDEREIAVNTTSTVRLEDPTTGEVRELGNGIRDELIALEHSARHYS